jgi:hypothetical protein
MLMCRFRPEQAIGCFVQALLLLATSIVDLDKPKVAYVCSLLR